MIAKIRNHAEPGIVDQVRSQVVANSLPDRRHHQRKSHHGPGVVHVQKGRNQHPQVEMPMAAWQAQGDRTFRRIGPQNLVKDWLEKESAKRVENSHGSQQKYARQPLQRVGQTVPYEAEKLLHAVVSACRQNQHQRCSGWVPIPVLYPGRVRVCFEPSHASDRQ